MKSEKELRVINMSIIFIVFGAFKFREKWNETHLISFSDKLHYVRGVFTQ